MKYFKNKIGSVSGIYWLFLAVMLLGIFLRTNHFRDFLVFNPDQARDAALVSDVLSGRSSTLILGPEAGNTHFDLGPWFYHLEIISAKIFGNDPWKLAYPDLFFGILTIPLFYIFAKKYFNQKISLALTFLLSISYFMVRYSRFAFNPNSIPFFVLLFLFGILYLLENGDYKKNIWGSVLVGIAIGVGMQLHILLFFIMPVITGLVFLYLILKKCPFKKVISSLGIILFFIILSNLGQIIYESKSDGANTALFFKAFSDSASGGGNFGRDFQMDLLCQSQANFHIVSSLGNTEQCDFYTVYNRFLRKGLKGLSSSDNITGFFLILGFIFTLGGYILLGYFWKKEDDEKKKNFLALVGIYGAVTLTAMLPIITQASLRYYIIIFFLGFIFLGLWIKFILQIPKTNNKKIILAFIIILVSLFQVRKINQVYAQFREGRAGDNNYAILGETEMMAKYIQARSQSESGVYFAGDRAYFNRFYKPIWYLAGRLGTNILRGDDSSQIPVNGHIFFVQHAISAGDTLKGAIMKHAPVDYKIFGNIMIVDLGK